MSHSDPAVAVELASWAIAIFASTAAMLLALSRPTRTVALRRRRGRQQRHEDVIKTRRPGARAA